MDHMRHDSVDFAGLEVLVLDEADRMLDMGFWPDVQRILAALPAEAPDAAVLGDDAGGSAEADAGVPARPEVRAGRPPRRAGADHLRMRCRRCRPARRRSGSRDWLRDEATGPVLVFCRTKIGADRLASRLSGMGIRTAALHADRTQQQRMAAVEGFRTGTYPVLVATDVAARGLDIDGIAHVVNFEVPDTPEAYVHRVGRTGRAESTGSALTLVAPEELRALRALEKAVGVQLQ